MLEFQFGKLHKLVAICRKMSVVENDFKLSTERTNTAQQLFGKITLHAIALCQLIPDKEEGLKTLDAASIAGIARNIIETHNVFQYLCEKGLSKDEFRFRISLMNYHHAMNVLKILDLFDFSGSDNDKKFFTVTKEDYKTELQSTAVFRSFSSKKQKETLRGHKAYYWELMRVRNSPLPKEMESAVYRLFSNSVHSFPLGMKNFTFNSMTYGAASSLNQGDLVYLALEVGTLYLANTALAYFLLRRKFAKGLSADEKTFVKEMIDIHYIRKWLEFRKTIGSRPVISLQAIETDPTAQNLNIVLKV